MFKLRRPSICSDLDILSDSDSVSDVTDEIQKGVSINSISESRSSLGSAENQQKKRSLSIDCDSISSKVGLKKSDRIEKPDQDEVGRGDQEFSKISTVGTTTAENTTSLLTLDKNVGILTNSPIPNNYVNSTTTTTTTPTAAAIMCCDRKRKERHESCSRQGQEKKVIRSLSHDDQKGETDADKQDFRRTQSHDDFQPNNTPSPVDIDEEREVEGRKVVERQQQQANKSNCNKNHSVNGRPTTLLGEQQQMQQVNPSRNSEPGIDIDRSSYGVGTASNPHLSTSVRNVPTNFEAELQRQWERSAQYSSNGSRKSHSGRKHRSRSGKSSALSTPSKTRSSYTEETEDGRDDDVDEIVGECIPNEDELSSPTSEESTTTSIDSLEEIENCGKLSCEDIETDLVVDSANTGRQEARDQRLGVGSSSSNIEPLPHLDFSTLHHQVETNEPISFLAALSGIEADQVMLSPRNSVLIKDTIDPSIPPSPPLYQTMVDPPISRQHGGNQNIRMNQLSKQVSNLKRHLKTLEDEHEQLFGYKPSHADKLNHKEMRKCLLQFTKAKRELKQMREDPANVRVGGNLLQVLNSSVPQSPFPRGSPEALKCLDHTVKEINKTLVEKRRINCRPDDPSLMNPSELNEEKSAMQKQLLMLEKKHGRPISKDEKDIVRSLYDRYRSLKKTGSRLGNIKENSIDLAPILEYETLELTPNEPEGNNTTSIVELRKASLPGISSSSSSKEGKRRAEVDEEDEGSVINIGNEGFTDMTLAELEQRQMSARDEKRRLRVLLRKYDEKHSSPEMESIYQKYKKQRATLRLLDVLITKRKYPLIVDKNED